jgi:hypothetical protein
MARFGYSPDRAEGLKNRLDHHLGLLEGQGRTIGSIVPLPGPFQVRLDAALEEIRGVVSDTQELVDKETTREEVPAPW